MVKLQQVSRCPASVLIFYEPLEDIVPLILRPSPTPSPTRIRRHPAHQTWQCFIRPTMLVMLANISPSLYRATPLYPPTTFAVFSRPSYRASIRMIGARVAGGECINGEGTKSLHMADGATYLYKTGLEYLDIGATWDWQRLPGTTVQVNGTVLNCSTSDSTGVLPNVGGVTDGLIGMTYSASKRLRISVPEKPFHGLAQWTLLNLHMGNLSPRVKQLSMSTLRYCSSAQESLRLQVRASPQRSSPAFFQRTGLWQQALQDHPLCSLQRARISFRRRNQRHPCLCIMLALATSFP